MKFPSRINRVVAGLLAVALVSLAASSVAAQSYYPQAQYQPQPPDPSQGYAQPQYAQPQYGAPQYAPGPQYAPQGQPMMAPQQPMDPSQAAMSAAMSPDQLAQLVAPIALYPDALVAQILAGATYPAQIAAADQWVHQMGPAGPDQIAAAVSGQTMWDPSIKGLTAYPQVLDMLAGNLQWTTVLGNAYYNQPQDVLQTVQVMRMRAQQAGTLVNTPQMPVVQNAGYISLQPPTDDTMYVPTYNPWTSYGQPVQPYPGFSFTGILSTLANAFLGGGFGGGNGFGSGVGGGALQFLSSFALGAFNRTPFGLIAWGLDWLFNALSFHHNDYYTASHSVRDWGLPHGGPRYYARASYAGDRFRGGIAGNYNHQPIAIHGGNMGGERFAGNNGFGRTQPAFGGAARPEYQHQLAYNRAPQPVFRDQYNGGRDQYNSSREQFNGGRPQYGNTFAARATEPRMSMTQPSRPDNYRGSFGGMQPARQSYQNPAGSYAQRGAMPGYSSGFASRSGSMAYNSMPDRSGFGSGSERSGGFFGGGGGSYKAPKFSEPKFKEPKMPKMQSFKAPKEHGGGGHFGGGHSGGGHSGGGHHR